MKNFCIITNTDKENCHELAKQIKNILLDLEASCVILENKPDYHKIAGVRDTVPERELQPVSFTDATMIPENIQCAIVLGGDGTMIQAAKDLVHRELYILGINMGTLGFLTEVEIQNLAPALKRVVEDDYGVENRTMLSGKLTRKEEVVPCGYVLNEYVLGKRGACRLITVHVYVNDEWVDTYRADGLICSTATGSTGYNLSAGGPVLAPYMHSMVITPICAHSLNKRSLVVSSKDVLRFEIGRTKDVVPDQVSLVADGKIVASLESGDSLELRIAKEETKLVKLTKVSFFERMREKLNGD